MEGYRGRAAVLFSVVGLSVTAVVAHGQMQHEGSMKMDAKSTDRSARPAPIRITMSALHAQGGVPRGWKFLIPRGDAADGRKVFVSMECCDFD